MLSKYKIRLLTIRLEYIEINAKCQLHLKQRRLPTPSNPSKNLSITIKEHLENGSISGNINDTFICLCNITCIFTTLGIDLRTLFNPTITSL